MKRRVYLGAFAGIALYGSLMGSAGAALSPLMEVIQQGDIVLIGNTLAQDCNFRPGMPVPAVGTVGNCGTLTSDSGPDVFWRSDEPSAGQATADETILPDQARSTAMLSLPPGSRVTHAFLYWSAPLPAGGSPDREVTLERPGEFSTSVSSFNSDLVMDSSLVYQSEADITTIVQAWSSGAYRLGGVDARTLTNATLNNVTAAWWMVVFYKNAAEPFRLLSLFDGLSAASDTVGINVPIFGFVVPAGGDARLGVVAYGGSEEIRGDHILWNGSALYDAMNPADNFFNGTRSFMGAPGPVPGDLPQLSGTPGSMSELDLDVCNIPVSPGQEIAVISIGESGFNDLVFIGGLITSIATESPEDPDFSVSSQSVVNLTGSGATKKGDILEYTITAANTGPGTGVDTVLSDLLPPEVTYERGSLEITVGENAGVMTDELADDPGEYDEASRTVRVRLGVGATYWNGGAVTAGTSSTVTFQVRVTGDTCLVANQAAITAAGLYGRPPITFVADGNGSEPGSPSSVVTVCEPPGPCQTRGLCDVATGQCAYFQDADGASCDDGDRCTEDDACRAGQCGGRAKDCALAPGDECHRSGECDRSTGLCANPAKDDGAPCGDGDPCSEPGACQAGICVPGVSKDCSPFVCERYSGDCLTQCRTSDDCVVGLVCDQSSQCVAPPPVASGRDSLCTASPPSPSAPAWSMTAASSLLVALALLRRRACR